MSSGAPHECGSTIRYPSVALLNVNTDDGFQYTPTSHELIEGPNPSNLRINNGRTILAGYLRRLALTDAQIEWNVPNVNQYNRSLTIDLQDASGVHVSYARMYMDVGFYSPAKLIKALEDEINANSTLIAYFTPLGVSAPYFNVYLANEDGTPVISSTGTASSTVTTNIPRVGISLTTAALAQARFTLVSSQASIAVTGRRQEPNDLLDMLGWTVSNGGVKSYVTYLGSYASFQYTPYIDLVSQTLTKNQKVSDADSSVNSLPSKLARIYLSNEAISKFYAEATYDASGVLVGYDDNVIGTAPFQFRREFKFPKQIAWNTQQMIDYIELQILDYRGQYLPIDFKTNDVEEIDPDTGNPYVPPRYVHEVPNFAEFRFTVHVSED